MNNSLNFIGSAFDRPQFDNLQNELRRELDPRGFLEEEVFGALVEAAWNRRRVVMLLAGLSKESTASDPLADLAVASQYDRYSQYQLRYQRAFSSALKELRVLQSSRPKPRFIDARRMPVPVPVSTGAVTRRAAARKAKLVPFPVQAGPDTIAA